MPSSTVAPVRDELFRLAPEFFQIQLKEWIQRGTLPADDLLYAVLNNDLGAVVAYVASDGSTFVQVRAILMWLWNTAPSDAFGSPAKVESWHAHAGEEGWRQ